MKKTIGKSPLAAYLSKSNNKKKPELKQVAKSVIKSKPQVKIVPKVSKIKETVQVKEEVLVTPVVHQEDNKLKTRVTIHIPVNLIERIKNAVYWEPGLTVAGFCEQALLKGIEKLEKEKGAPYPSRKEQLKGGRPIK